MVTSSGQAMAGGVVSSTVTETWSLSCSIPSETTSVTAVVPIGNWPVGVGEFGLSKTTPGADHEKVNGSPSGSAEPVPLSATGVVVGDAHSAVMSAPASATGGWFTMIAKFSPRYGPVAGPLELLPSTAQLTLCVAATSVWNCPSVNDAEVVFPSGIVRIGAALSVRKNRRLKPSPS